MRIAVADDERPSRSELAHLIRELRPEARVDEANSGQQALELASEETYDAMFVDIHLGDMTGTSLAQVLKKLLPGVQIVFATAYDQYAVKAFDLDVTDYIMKPFDPRRVEQALCKLEERLAAAQAAPVPKAEEPPPVAGKLSITCDKRVVLIDITDIAYIETDSRLCILHTRQGDYQSSQPLSSFEKRLAAAQFFRIHKSYLINLQYLLELYPWFNGMVCVKLRGYEKENLPVSRKQVKPLKELFEI